MMENSFNLESQVKEIRERVMLFMLEKDARGVIRLSRVLEKQAAFNRIVQEQENGR